jgi:hypothetical protein
MRGALLVEGQWVVEGVQTTEGALLVEGAAPWLEWGEVWARGTLQEGEQVL